MPPTSPMFMTMLKKLMRISPAIFACNLS
jgi:hypothetical protein